MTPSNVLTYAAFMLALKIASTLLFFAVLTDLTAYFNSDTETWDGPKRLRKYAAAFFTGMGAGLTAAGFSGPALMASQ